MSNNSKTGCSTTDIFIAYLHWIIKLTACLIVLSLGLKTIWSTLKLINIIAFYLAWFLELSILVLLLSVFIFGTCPDIQASPEETFIIECRSRSRALLPHTMAQDMNSEVLDEPMADAEDVIMGQAEQLEEVPFIDMSPKIDNTAEDIYLDDLSSNEEEIPQEEEPVWKSNITAEEKTAEDGWIVLLDEPTGPYDYDNDPAGLYRGIEVDDRPSIVEYLHQDARSKGIFATMAPTEADVAAFLAALRLEAALGTSEGLFTSSRPTSRFRPRIPNVPTIPEYQPIKPKALNVPTHISKPPRSYAQALRGVTTPSTSKSAPILPISTKKTDTPSPFSKKKEKSCPETKLTIFDKRPKRNTTTTAKDQEESDLQKAIRLSLEVPDKAQGGSDLQMAIQAFKTDREKGEADLQKAIRESMRPMLGGKSKSGSASLAGSSSENPDSQNELRSVMSLSKDGEKRQKVDVRAIDGEEPNGEKEDGEVDEMAYLRVQMQIMDGTVRPRYRF